LTSLTLLTPPRVKRASSYQAVKSLAEEGLAVVAGPGFPFGLARADPGSAMHERHEAHRQKFRLADPRLGLVDLDELLGVACVAEWDDHAAAHRELIDQSRRRLIGCRGHDDAVERRLWRPTEPA